MKSDEGIWELIIRLFSLSINQKLEVFINRRLDRIRVSLNVLVISCRDWKCDLVTRGSKHTVLRWMNVVLGSDKELPSLHRERLDAPMMDLLAFFRNYHMLNICYLQLDDVNPVQNWVLAIIFVIRNPFWVLDYRARVNHTQICIFLLNFEDFFSLIILHFTKIVYSFLVLKVKSMNPNFVVRAEQLQKVRRRGKRDLLKRHFVDNWLIFFEFFMYFED